MVLIGRSRYRGAVDEVPTDGVERGEVVHVVVELRHVHDRRFAQAVLQPGELTALARRDLLELRQIAEPRREALRGQDS